MIAANKARMAMLPCRKFEESPPERRFCPFGSDCHFLHLDENVRRARHRQL